MFIANSFIEIIISINAANKIKQHMNNNTLYKDSPLGKNCPKPLPINRDKWRGLKDAVCLKERGSDIKKYIKRK